jgi:NADPH:quinone reductase-like Zn-dependent oxidoreductase
MLSRALLYDRYGPLDVLRFGAVERPSPSRGFVRVRVRAAALNPKDIVIRAGKYRFITGHTFPKFVGSDFAGEVEEVGAGVRDLAPGDRVFGALNEWRMVRGTLAEHVLVRESECARWPEGRSFEEAAAVPICGQTALQALSNIAKVERGDRVCIHGASGGVGVFAIQVAKILGASVTTTSSAPNRAMCEALGADLALDYTRGEAFAERRRYRVVFDVFGNLSFAKVRASLEPRGVFVTTVPSARATLDALSTPLGFPRARMVVVRSRRADLEQLASWIAASRLCPVIDRVYEESEAIAAFRHLATKRARGKIVVRIRA